jgi:hypothetical protein
MSDLKTLTHAQFESCVHQPFHIDGKNAGPIEAELIEVETRGVLDPGIQRRRPFSVIFRGPMEPILPQSIYAMKNEILGNLEVFLVPIGPDKHGMRYEAVFS